LGVVTLPEFRGKGFAKILINYAHQQIAEEGYILRYRTQTDNLPSIKLAESLGLKFYGLWEPIKEEAAS
jgi:GNAT superfamily N-acetyltransferase